jgi:hypothetical protein
MARRTAVEEIVPAEMNAEEIVDQGAEIAEGVAPEAGENGDKEKKQKKLGKSVSYENNTVTIDVLGGSGTKHYCSDDLPEPIQQKLCPFGLGHKLGDAAAGKEGMVAEEAIEKVWQGLMANDWSVRAPATPKVSLKELEANYLKMDEADQAIAKSLFEKLGIKFQ